MIDAEEFSEFGDWALVLAGIAAGTTVTDACGACGLSPVAYYKARKGNPHLQAAHETAQEIGDDALADKLVSAHTLPNALAAKVASENWRWLLSRRQSAKFGDKVTIQNENNDLVATLREAIARIPRPLPRPETDLSPLIEGEKLSISAIMGDDSV